MTELKRDYVVPLRRKTSTAPRWRRSKKAMSVLKEYMRKHMKADDVIICKELNEFMWQNGIKNPPGKVSVTALRTEVHGEMRTIVNLASVGVDEQAELYKTQVAAPQVATKEETSEVKDAKVEEKPVVEDKKEETKAEEKPAKKETPKKTETKKEEVKKNE